MNEVRRAYDKLRDLQPCEDCISRYELREAISALTYWHFNDGGKLEIGGAFDNTVYKVDDVERLERVLPSVTPSRPRGKWIHWTDDYKDYVTCSCCEYGEEGEVLLSDKTPFCPICGAEMENFKE